MKQDVVAGRGQIKKTPKIWFWRYWFIWVLLVALIAVTIVVANNSAN
jgi:hypothetical protein